MKASELCDRCGAHLENWKEVFGEEHHCPAPSDCPIGLDKIHCQNCKFNPQGECTYRALELQFGKES